MPDFNALSNIYKQQADKFIENINRTSVTLYFSPHTVSPISNPLPNQPTSLNRLGGRVPNEQLPGQYMNATGNYQSLPTTETILARVYYINNPYEKEALGISVANNKNACKVITYIEDQSKILNAAEAEINGERFKMVRHAAPHGLFERRYITSYWEAVN